MLLYKYFAVKSKVCRQTAAGPFLSLSSSYAIVVANGEITKVINGLRKEETIKTGCSLAWPDHSLVAQGVTAFSLY